MKPDTVEKLMRALDAIQDQFRMIESAKSEKTIEETCDAITEAQVALLKELPDVQY